jgi:hypothetical protein
MHRVRYEPTIAELKRAKAVHALDTSATVTGLLSPTLTNMYSWGSNKYYFSVLMSKCETMFKTWKC